MAKHAPGNAGLAQPVQFPIFKKIRNTVLHFGFGYGVLAAGLAFWFIFFPLALHREWEKFREQNLEGRTFNQYLSYNFNYWMISEGIKAHALILLGGCVTLATFGAIAYYLLCGRSPIEGLWMVFVWASASSVDPSASTSTCMVGVMGTLGGLLLLALLLSTITDYFNSRVEATKEGRDPVVEGNHVLVIGYSANTKSLLEEISMAEEERHTVALLSSQPKVKVEQMLEGDNCDIENVKLVVRTGSSNAWQDLRHVGADTACRIVIPEDPSLSREESDAKTFGALLTLKGRDWPANGYVTVQCSLSRNEALMQSLHPGKALVVNGERLGRIMVQSACDPGLCKVFSQIIGFEGDEFYSKSAGDLGVTGVTFRELPFFFPTAVPLGLIDKDGKVDVNPAKDREVASDDEVIVLAEDASSVNVCSTPIFDYAEWASSRKPATFTEDSGDDFSNTKSLIANFHDRGYGCSILFALDEMMGKGSEVDIYTGLSEETCMSVLDDAQRRQGRMLENIVPKIYTAPQNSMTSKHNLEALPLATYNYVFVLADAQEKPDQKTVAMILQMQNLLQDSDRSSFDPVVEISSDISAAQLKLCGITNSVNTSLILSRALAMVTMNKLSHGVLTNLLSADGNNFDIQSLANYLGADEELPAALNFTEATAYVARGARQVLIGWSDGAGPAREWIINPKDKAEARPWSPEDRLVVIKMVS